MRRLFVEQLEGRVLLAGDVTSPAAVIDEVASIETPGLLVDAPASYASSRISGQLARVAYEYDQWANSNPTGPFVPSDIGLSISRERVVVDAVSVTSPADLAAALKDLGAEITGAYGQGVSAWVPFAKIRDLSGIPSLTYAKTSTPIVWGSPAPLNIGAPAGAINAATAAATLQADVQDVEESLNQFALDLYQTITDSNSTKPIDEAISPFSIAAALAMTYAGANGETASQLAHALHVDLPPDRFHAAMETILQDILPADSDSTTQLEIADSLWGQSGFPFLDSFRQLTHDRYGADFHEADFEHAPDAATDAINDWVQTQTHDMIDKLFDSLSSDTRLVLANALYFKASWATAFDTYATQRTAFHLASGSSMDVSMMHESGYFGYTETSEYQIAELPYAGGRYSMVVLLPKQTDANLKADFSASDLENWLGSMQSTDLSVALPKFKLETSMSLIDTLNSLGVTDAFGGSADFSGIDGQRDLYISQAVHKAVVEVNETGTKAAAVTGIAIGFTSDAYHVPVTPTPFYADHPFHFLIRDRETNSILFMGQVQHPSAYDGDDSTATELPHLTVIGPPEMSSPVTTNPANRFDVNGDGQETPKDVLIVVDYLNEHASPTSVVQSAGLLIHSKVYPDVDGSGTIVPRDALILIDRLNERGNDDAATKSALNNSPVQGEGEAPAASSVDDLFAAAAEIQPSQLRRRLF